MYMLKPAKGMLKKKKRVGRGPGSGTGKTSGRGMNGQNCRTGGGVRLGFEGGQTPIFRRLPKRGFKNSRFQIDYNEVNVQLLDDFADGSVINKDALEQKGLLTKKNLQIKILGDGELTKKLEVWAEKFSKNAIEKIEKAGGKVVIVKTIEKSKKIFKAKKAEKEKRNANVETIKKAKEKIKKDK